VEGLNDARTPHRTSCVLGQRGCLGRLREGGLNIRLGWAGEKGNFFNACWNSTGDPALRWEVARVWRLGRRVSYGFVSAQLKLRPARQAGHWALIGGKQIGPRGLGSSRQRRVLPMKTG
jgi:hypothetical protein